MTLASGSRLFHPAYTRNGKRIQQAELAVRIQKDEIRHAFNLNTANRAKTARKAAEIYTHLTALGGKKLWLATLVQHLPERIAARTS